LSKLQAPGLARAAQLLEERAAEISRDLGLDAGDRVVVARELRAMAVRVRAETVSAPGSTSVLQRSESAEQPEDHEHDEDQAQNPA
jgi:hypothetical protein